MKQTDKLKCYECKHIGEIDDSTYVYCKNRQAVVEGHPTGITRGWFDWPYQFSPVWLVKCSGYEQKGDSEIGNTYK